MPSIATTECRTLLRKGSDFKSFYGILLLFSLHWALVLYINSSFLEQFVSASTVSILYISAAALTIIGFLHASPLLTRFGNIPLMLSCTAIEFTALLAMAFTASPYIAVVAFIIHQTIVPIILFNLDVLMEELIGEQEGSTGKRRGLLLTIMSLTGALASFLMGKLMGTGDPNFFLVYTASAVILIPFIYYTWVRFRHLCNPLYPRFEIFQGISHFWKYQDVRNVFFAHFLLQLFFTWMVIYSPLYLFSVIGFNWEQIGAILFVGLSAYVLLEYPIGVIADTYLGEKEMMAFGFVIIAIATSWFVFLDTSSILAWMITMFMTRVGASLVETTTESYFFKHTQGKDTNLIGLFRITRPLSYVIGAVLGGVTLYYLDFSLLFVVLGLLMIPGLFFAMVLHDTK